MGGPLCKEEEEEFMSCDRLRLPELPPSGSKPLGHAVMQSLPNEHELRLSPALEFDERGWKDRLDRWTAPETPRTRGLPRTSTSSPRLSRRRAKPAPRACLRASPRPSRSSWPLIAREAVGGHVFAKYRAAKGREWGRFPTSVTDSEIGEYLAIRGRSGQRGRRGGPRAGRPRADGDGGQGSQNPLTGRGGG